MQAIETVVEWYAWSVTGFWGWLFSAFVSSGDPPPPVRGYLILAATAFTIYAAYLLFEFGRHGRLPGFFGCGDRDDCGMTLGSLVWGPAVFPLAAGTVIAVWPAALVGLIVYWLGKLSAVRRCKCGRRMKSRHKFCAACGDGADGRAPEATATEVTCGCPVCRRAPGKTGTRAEKQKPSSQCLDRVGSHSFKPEDVICLIETDAARGRLVTVYSARDRPTPFGVAIDATINGCSGITLVRLKGDLHAQLGYTGWSGSRFRMFLPGEKVVIPEDSS